MITGLSILLMGTGLYLSLAGHDGPTSTKYFCIMLGILSWFCGNKLNELEERLDELENRCGSSKSSPAAPEARPTA
jgi:hypothetical protein